MLIDRSIFRTWNVKSQAERLLPKASSCGGSSVLTGRKSARYLGWNYSVTFCSHILETFQIGPSQLAATSVKLGGYWELVALQPGSL